MKLFIILAIFGYTCATEQDSTRIVGGTVASIEQYPFIASVQLLESNVWWFHLAGGTLLTRVIVLSSSGFFRDYPENRWRVRLGSNQASSGGSIHPVSEIVVNPETDSQILLTIIRLSIPAVYSDSIQRASIAGPNYILPEGTTVHAAGWGSLRLAHRSSEILHRVDMEIVSQDYCVERYDALPHWPNVTDTMFCAGIDGRSTCDFDRGGPVIHNSDVLFGVIAFSYGCGTRSYPAVHYRVSDYSSWIASFS